MNDEARVSEIKALFKAKGWSLQLAELGHDLGWEAAFWLDRLGGGGQVSHGPTRLAAAEEAWAKYVREPWLGGE